MGRRGYTTILVLAAFAVTTALPGPQMVAHRHEGADHDHVHAFLVGDDDHHHAHDHDDDHDHDHHHAADHHRHRTHARRHHHARGPAFARDHHDPLAHVHVASRFHPAAIVATIDVAATRLITADPPPPTGAPRVRHRTPDRSRGPPSAPLA